ncbi:MAG: 30S ribosomal protein S11 [Patescibacteria group bacterium]|nr:30S ribosomal protein S11 [Patescibacteria group bacterium]MCL5093809.1 30S ribosomal protein S11 [Patescibacteria group bacterium]
MAEQKKQIKKRKVKKIVPHGLVYVNSTFNNTIVTFTDLNGNVLKWTSCGANNFKGSRKATPYAAQISASKLAEAIKSNFGMEKVDVFVKGIGSGRESAVRAINAVGIFINSIKDITPIPHNGCRPKKPRRT